MSVFVLQKGLVLLVLLTTVPSCKPIQHRIKLDKAAAKKLQVFVNEGHEPWRLDARYVAAERILHLRKLNTKDYDVFNFPLDQVMSSETQGIFQYRGSRKTYRVTVQRFGWLLPLARQWKWVVWTPVEEEIIPDCAKVRRS